MILYGEFGGNTMTDPEVEWAGTTASTDETSLSVVEAEDFGETNDVRNRATGLAFSATLN